jgi:hypothetical protein
MRRLLLALAAVVFACGLAQAQSALTPPGMGATSPLGAPGAPLVGPVGIPLGATEINPGGLSPLPDATGSNCPAGGPFDGGGSSAAVGILMSGTSAGGNCASMSSAMPSSGGIASPLFTPGTTAGSSPNGGTIPLGATEIGGGGVSQLGTVPIPGVQAFTLPAPVVGPATSTSASSATTTTPCAGSAAMGITGLGTTSLGQSSTSGTTGGVAVGTAGLAGLPSSAGSTGMTGMMSITGC